MKALLATHAWLLQHVPSSTDNDHWPTGTTSDAEVLALIDTALSDASGLDRKVALSRELRDFEAERRVTNRDMQRQFHLCQAMWASKYDLDGARAPGADDAYLLAPRE